MKVKIFSVYYAKVGGSTFRIRSYFQGAPFQMKATEHYFAKTSISF